MECLLANGASLAALGPLYDEQARWAEEAPWHSQITLKSFDYSAPSGGWVDVVSVRAVLEVRWMLHKILRLPSNAVNRIFDFSQYWSHSFILRKEHVKLGGPDLPDDDDIAYLSEKLSSKMMPGSLRKLVFTTKSHEISVFGMYRNICLFSWADFLCFRFGKGIRSRLVV